MKLGKLLKSISTIVLCLSSLSLGRCNATRLSFNNEEKISQLEQKVDALTKVVEQLLMESKAKDIKRQNVQMEFKAKEKNIQDLEKRVAELETTQTGIFAPITTLKENQRIKKDQKHGRTNIVKEEYMNDAQETESNTGKAPSNSDKFKSVDKEMVSKEHASKYKHIIHKSKFCFSVHSNTCRVT